MKNENRYQSSIHPKDLDLRTQKIIISSRQDYSTTSRPYNPYKSQMCLSDSPTHPIIPSLPTPLSGHREFIIMT